MSTYNTYTLNKCKIIPHIFSKNFISFSLIGLIATTAVWITLGFKSWTNPIVEPIGYAIKYVFMFIPTFNFGRAIMAIAQVITCILSFQIINYIV